MQEEGEDSADAAGGNRFLMDVEFGLKWDASTVLSGWAAISVITQSKSEFSSKNKTRQSQWDEIRLSAAPSTDWGRSSELLGRIIARDGTSMTFVPAIRWMRSVLA